MTVKPSAQGNLRKNPFSHLLLYMLGRKLSGTLAIWPDPSSDPDRSQDRILLQQGVIVAFRARQPVANSREGLIAIFARTDAPYGFYEGQNLLGSPDALREERFDTYNLVALGLRAHPRAEVIDPVLARIGSRSIRMRPGVPLDKLDLSPKERALVDVLRAGPATLGQLVRSSDLPETDVRRLFCLFALIRGIEATDGQQGISPVALDTVPPPPLATSQVTPAARPAPEKAAADRAVPEKPAADKATPDKTGPIDVSGVSQRTGKIPVPAGQRPNSFPSLPPPSGEVSMPAPPPPSGLSFEDRARWVELAAAHDHMDARTHFALLGVPETATEREANAAYFALVKKFHPDRLPPALAPLTRCAQMLFERITEANETLSHSDQRALYLAHVHGGGGTRASDRMMRDVVESVVDFQKAEILTKRRDYVQAMQLLKGALLKNPDESDYLALHGWLLHLMNPAEPAPLQEMLQAFDRALKSNPRNERAHYYRGVVLKRAKRDDEALRHFKLAIEINPRNVEAAREVRLATMRRASKPPPATGPTGILSKLFGGSKDNDR